ncbi:ABC transporter permease [Amycolatopsis nalaikhensis]|uniref:ABC transporter permease n=1 Tax=Amycolatopsis nalaikhensis TaxID=715472 RepID=A0ABY8XQQ6_9PSEU|nr:ABC transporter permease [Amycolatopsis sp. 2-2]WIV57990.1 ABC transporter permease [Amycolatopsis sp. 2-2]
MIWTFGREFSQDTVKDLLALPTPRTTIVAAKFAVTTGWSLALTAQTYLLGLLLGAAIGLPSWSAAGGRRRRGRHAPDGDVRRRGRRRRGRRLIGPRHPAGWEPECGHPPRRLTEA